MYTNACGQIIDCIRFTWGIYGHSHLICAHEIIGTCGMYMAFQGHICCWYIYGYSIVNKSFSWLFLSLTCIYSNMMSTYRLTYRLHIILEQGSIHMRCVIHIWSGPYASNVKYMYSSAPGHTVDYSKFIWCIYILT